MLKGLDAKQCATNSAKKDGTTGADLDLQRSPMLKPYSG